MAIRMLRRLGRAFGDRRGAVSPMMTLMLIPLIGALAMATEASSWFFLQRSMQNAADAAVLAAATNDCAATASCHTVALSPTYDSEAASVAAKFGFENGVSDTTVTTINNAPCPAGGSDCYKVTITRLAPIYMTRVVGFNGDATTSNGDHAQTVSASAIARRKGHGQQYCVVALGTSSSAISFNGAHSLNLKDCDLFTPNGGAQCTNQVGNSVRYSDVSNTGASNKDCGTERQTSATFTDNYAALRNQIPASGCSSYPQAPSSGPNKDMVTTPANLLSGALTFSAANQKCGDVRLAGDVTVGADSVLVINNGRLDLAGHKLSTINGAHLTLIFTGSSSPVTRHYPTSTVNGGVMDFSAPNSGTWSGVAIYQDPTLTTGVDITNAGNNPQWDITGLVYAPKSNLTVQGAINHATAGDACLAFVTLTFSLGGTGDIFADPTEECDHAGLTLPTVPGTESRQALVQ